MVSVARLVTLVSSSAIFAPPSAPAEKGIAMSATLTYNGLDPTPSLPRNIIPGSHHHHPSANSYFEMTDPFILGLPSSGSALSTLSVAAPPECWNGKSAQILRRSSQNTDHCFETPATSLSPIGESSLGETEASLLSTPIVPFSDVFPTTPPVEKTSPPNGENPPSFVSLFNLYMELHEALDAIRMGTRHVFLDDLKDGWGVMRAVIRASELGTTLMHQPPYLMTAPLPSPSEPLILFGLVVVLKGCELADAVASSILPAASSPPPPTTRPSPSYPTPLSICAPEPIFEPPKPAASPIDDFVWSAGANSPSASAAPLGSMQPSTPPRLTDEHITALIRLDIHLSHLNRAVATFTQVAAERGLASDHAVAMRQRRRLSHLHAQIRTVVDATIPAWD